MATISGQIQLINIKDGRLQCEIQAHVRCITSFDIANKLGYVSCINQLIKFKYCCRFFSW